MKLQDEIVMVQHHMAQSVRAGREIDVRLGDELELLMTRLMHSVRGCYDQLWGLGELNGNTVVVCKQIKMVCDAAMAEFADEALALWDRYKDIWKLEACWKKEVQG